MKNKIIIYIILFFNISITIPAQEKQLRIKYLGNMGVLISSGSSKVLIDALHQANPWGYGEPSKNTIENILSGQDEFKNAPLLLVTHNHADHFNPELTYIFLENKNNMALLTEQSAADIKNKYMDFNKIKSSIILTDNSENGVINFNKGNISVKGINLSHGNKTQNTGYIVETNGIKIFHSGDAEPVAENFAKYNLEEENIDIVILPTWFIDSGELVKSFNAKHVIFIHVHSEEIGNYNEYLEDGQILIEKLNEKFFYIKK